MAPHWEDTVSQKWLVRDQLIAPYVTDNLLDRPPQLQAAERSQINSDPKVQEITDVDNIQALLKQIEIGELKAEEVTRAYIKR